jgi:hypothetical protein
MYYPHGQIFFGMRLPLLLQRKKTRVAIEKVMSWEPQRIVLAHGRCFGANGHQILERLFNR